ncbi:MAG: glycosyltransferase family 2 protein [Deltaproteobacteria bacterium]|nr:glycosyltransferase family 2 protein [Deltaproteobacteria bacterium]
MTQPEFSIVIPLYNEAANLGELHARLTQVFARTQRSYEIVFVDDGSRDGTPERCKALADADACVRLVRLRRNFGQTAGLAAGIDHARGQFLVIMDGDLQHFPEDIPALIAKIDEGYDIASGWRTKRVDNFWLRRFPSKVANWLMRKSSGVELHDFAGFKCYRREVLQHVDLYGDLHRFMPALASWHGVKIAEVPIQNVERQRGKSNYGLSRTFRVLCDLLTVKFMISYVSRPLYFFGRIGLVLFGIGLAVALVLAGLFYGGAIRMTDHLGNLIFAMLNMVLGVQLIATGLVLEVLSRIYHTTHHRKIYAVAEVYERPIHEGLSVLGS